MERRTFLKTLPSLPAGIGASTTLLAGAGCAGPAWLVPTAGPGTLSVAVGALDGRSEALVELPGSNRPVLLLRGDDGGWTALHARCTHRGCQPDPVGDRLICPCHGSEFARDGAVLEGPADRPLRRFGARRDGDRIVIDLEGEG